MDPNLTWKELSYHLQAGNLRDAADYYITLKNWLDGGGFPPAWTVTEHAMFRMLPQVVELAERIERK